MNLWQVLYQLTYLGLAVLLLTSCNRPHSGTAPGEPLRVLFIGNSYTFFNNLPEMFAELARSGGYEVQADISAKGGLTLSDHVSSARTLEMMQKHKWDYVILQEQSVLPAKQQEREQRMYPAARTLDARIRQTGAETVLFMTWGRRDGLAKEGFSDLESMQAQLQAGYTEIAQELDAIVAPVGMAWQNATAQQPQLELWDQDGSHPGKSGSYLAACVFYVVLYQETPEGLAYVAGLPKETARFLQRIAAETVLKE